MEKAPAVDHASSLCRSVRRVNPPSAGVASLRSPFPGAKPRPKQIAGIITLRHHLGVITLVVGTNRPGSSSRRVAAEIEEIYRGLKVPLLVVDLANLPAAIFHPSSYGEKPGGFAPFTEADSALAR